MRRSFILIFLFFFTVNMFSQLSSNGDFDIAQERQGLYMRPLLKWSYYAGAEHAFQLALDQGDSGIVLGANISLGYPFYLVSDIRFKFWSVYLPSYVNRLFGGDPGLEMMAGLGWYFRHPGKKQTGLSLGLDAGVYGSIIFALTEQRYYDPFSELYRYEKGPYIRLRAQNMQLKPQGPGIDLVLKYGMGSINPGIIAGLYVTYGFASAYR